MMLPQLEPKLATLTRSLSYSERACTAWHSAYVGAARLTVVVLFIAFRGPVQWTSSGGQLDVGTDLSSRRHFQCI